MTEIIEVDFKPADPSDPPEPGLRVKRRHFQECNHKGTVVDETLRIIKCKTCGEKLDPIEVLLELARSFERDWHIRKGAATDYKRLCKDIEDLRRKKKNLQAGVRRAERKQETP